jgi:hypothetical protein
MPETARMLADSWGEGVLSIFYICMAKCVNGKGEELISGCKTKRAPARRLSHPFKFYTSLYIYIYM